MDMIPQDNTPYKLCSNPICENPWLPATTEFFRRDRGRLTSRCKKCLTDQAKDRYHNDAEYREKRLTEQKVYRAIPEVQERSQAYKKAYYSQPENLEHKYAQDKEYRKRPEVRERDRVYNKLHMREYRDRPGVRDRIRTRAKSQEVRARKRAYYHRPGVHEHTVLYFRSYRDENREQINTSNRTRRQRPLVRAKNLARMRIYESRPEVREQKLIRKHARLARLKSIPGTLISQQIQQKLRLQHFRCYYCHAKFERRNGKYIYHFEHTVPVSRVEAQPRHDMSFVVLACPTCNLKKHNKLPHEFHEGGRLL